MTALPWARRLIAAGRRVGTLPRYGDEVWRRLADADARKVAAAVVAAECWRRGGEELPGRLADEISLARAAEEQLDVQAFATVAAYVRSFANKPTHAELEARRAELLAPRPNDHPGGPVAPW